MLAVEQYLQRYLRISSGTWSKLVLNLSPSNICSTFLLGYQRHLRKVTTFKLIKLMRKCTELGLRCDTNGNDFVRAGLTEFVRRCGHFTHNVSLDVSLLRDLSYILRNNQFCQSDISKVSICYLGNCNTCKQLYGKLLEYKGGRLVFDTVKLLSSKIKSDCYKIRKKRGIKYLSEAAITPFFSLVGSLNMEFGHELRTISALYLKRILESKSLVNIAMVLHVLSKISCRCGLLKKRLVKRLSRDNLLQFLEKEKSDLAKQISIGQLICSALYLTDTRMANLSHKLLFDLIKIIGEKWKFEQLSQPLKSQLALYHSYVTSGFTNSTSKVYELLNEVKRDFEQTKPTPIVRLANLEPVKWKTTVFQSQVSSVLREMGCDIECEIFIYPYIVDILLDKKIIIEVNGPCHYINRYHFKHTNLDLSEEIGHLKKLSKNTLLKQKILTQQGYKVIQLSYLEWPSDKNSQIDKMSRLLAEI